VVKHKWEILFGIRQRVLVRWNLVSGIVSVPPNLTYSTYAIERGTTEGGGTFHPSKLLVCVLSHLYFAVVFHSFFSFLFPHILNLIIYVLIQLFFYMYVDVHLSDLFICVCTNYFIVDYSTLQVM